MAAAALAPTGAGAAPPPTLTGETLSDPTPTVTGSCVLIARFSFTADGADAQATGPYEGSFTESGEATLPFNTFTASFTIESPVGQVTGTKSGRAGLMSYCGDDLSEARIRDGVGTYTAEIRTPDGRRFLDRGTTSLALCTVQPSCSGGPPQGFTETFTSDLGSPIGQAARLTLSPKAAANPVGSQHTVTATASDSAGNPVPGVTVRFSVTGANSASGSDTTDQDGQATFTYTGTNQGVDAISAFADNDDNGTQDPGEPADTATKVWFSGAARGSFVIGDQNATLGNRVTFWGAQWWKLNSLSGGPAPPSFKGFASNTPNNPPRCGDSWTSRPGNSSNPPATVPEFIAVIASSSITKSGSTISGNTPEVVVVKTDPGYAPNPGHSGTGTVVAEVCQS